MEDNYAHWNDTVVAHTFMRLIKKTNHPYNNNKLTYDEYQKSHNSLLGYIKWHKLNHKKNTASLYDFSQENMLHILVNLSYNVDNYDYLIKIWRKDIIGLESDSDSDSD